MKSLAELLTSARILSLAPPETIRRGQQYYHSGRVQSLGYTARGIRAYVEGERMYLVELAASGNRLEFACSCPVGEHGGFCKHCIAAAITFLNTPRPDDAFDLESLRPHLEAETPTRLASLILEWAAENDLLQQSLYQFKANLAGPDAAINAARKAFQDAALPVHPVPASGAPAVVAAISRAVDTFERLLEKGYAAAVMDLCEFGLRTLTKTHDLVNVDDDLSLPANRLESLHREAARQAQPNPVHLAERLFHLEANANIYAFYGAAETYRELLGPEGLAAYKQLAENHDFIRPRDRNAILESLARATGRVEDWIALIARDLSSPEAFLRIIAACIQANARPLALTWAERGYKLYPYSAELRAACIAEYNHAGRPQDVANLR